MKKISIWARHHKSQARIILIISFIILNILAVIVGRLFFQSEINFGNGFLMGSFIGLIAIAIIYPSKKLKGSIINNSAYYFMQKSCDFMLAACTFCMLICISNRPENIFQFYPKLNAFAITIFHKDTTAERYKSITDFYNSLKDKNGNILKWKERKKLLKEQVKTIKKDNELSKGAKTTLIILSCLAAVGLFLLVASLSCSLSCGGSDAAAVLVGIGGTALIIFLLVLVIRSINGKKRKKKIAAESTEPN